jgi:CheY-like chemotaxis protein
MSRPGRVLFVDDEKEWRDAVTEALADAGFKVDAVASIGEAGRRLAKDFYHLLILDIVMDETNQETSREGMTLLRELVEEQNLGTALKIVMLSGHATREEMRESFRRFEVADFISKQDYVGEKFVEDIRAVFEKEVRVNLGLEIHWKQGAEPEQLVLNLEVEGRRVKRDDPALPLLAAELDDLLCRLFHDASSLLVRPLGQGMSGSGVLWVQPFYKGAGQPRVVKFGDFRQADLEYSNYREHVEKYISGGRCTSIPEGGLRRTARLGGIIYSLLGAAGEEMESFGRFYERADAAEVAHVLDGLFFDTCRGWYTRLRETEGPLDLTEEYRRSLGFTAERLHDALEKGLKAVQGKQKLRFGPLGEGPTFTNPVLAAERFRFEEKTYTCRTHGDLNENNVLVDVEGRTWLIDFDTTGEGHILRDVAELESVVRFKLLGPEEADLEERWRMEEVLCGMRRFSEVDELASRFNTANPALAKAYATAVHLRGIARRLVLQSDETDDYLVALFYYAINTIRFYQLPAVQRQHALLSASLLADRLG